MSSNQKMTAVARRRLQALSEQLVAPIGDQGQFENIPKLKKIAPDSAGPRVKGKVVIVTGWLENLKYHQNLAFRLTRTKAQIPLSALDGHQPTNSLIMAQKPSTSVTTMTLTSRRTSVSLRPCTPRSRSIPGSSTLRMRSR